jgi:hypothetical protein
VRGTQCFRSQHVKPGKGGSASGHSVFGSTKLQEGGMGQHVILLDQTHQNLPISSKQLHTVMVAPARLT